MRSLYRLLVFCSTVQTPLLRSEVEVILLARQSDRQHRQFSRQLDGYLDYIDRKTIRWDKP